MLTAATGGALLVGNDQSCDTSFLTLTHMLSAVKTLSVRFHGLSNHHAACVDPSMTEI